MNSAAVRIETILFSTRLRLLEEYRVDIITRLRFTPTLKVLHSIAKTAAVTDITSQIHITLFAVLRHNIRIPLWDTQCVVHNVLIVLRLHVYCLQETPNRTPCHQVSVRAVRHGSHLTMTTTSTKISVDDLNFRTTHRATIATTTTVTAIMGLIRQCKLAVRSTFWHVRPDTPPRRHRRSVLAL